MAIVFTVSSHKVLAGGKSGGSGGSKPAGPTTSDTSPKLFKQAVLGTHYKDTTISMRKTGAGKVSHSDVNVQKTNDKASPALDGVKGEAKEDHHKDVIH